MALYSVAQGGVENALDVNQYQNLLTGTMTDQQVTVANRIRATNTGASAGSGGYMGQTGGGPPVSGTFAVGDFVSDGVQNTLWVCNTAGTPGTWLAAGTARIASTLTTGTTASVSFTSIPQTFTNLLVVMNGRGDTAAVTVDVSMTFNSDTGAHYSQVTWNATAGSPTPSGTGGTAQTAISWASLMAAASAAAGSSGGGTILIPNYTGSTFMKCAYIQCGRGDSGGCDVRQRWGFWAPTSQQAITTITLTPGAGNFVTGSLFDLYGLP